MHTETSIHFDHAQTIAGHNRLHDYWSGQAKRTQYDRGLTFYNGVTECGRNLTFPGNHSIPAAQY